MSTNASIGHGSQFQRSSDGTSGGIFATVAGVNSVAGPGLSRDTIDVTDMDSTNRWREHIGGLKDAGEVTLELEFDPDGSDVTNFLADINNDASGYYKIIFPDATEWGFAAILTGYEPSSPQDEKMVATVTYKLTGQPTFIS